MGADEDMAATWQQQQQQQQRVPPLQDAEHDAYFAVLADAVARARPIPLLGLAALFLPPPPAQARGSKRVQRRRKDKDAASS